MPYILLLLELVKEILDCSSEQGDSFPHYAQSVGDMEGLDTCSLMMIGSSSILNGGEFGTFLNSSTGLHNGLARPV